MGQSLDGNTVRSRINWDIECELDQSMRSYTYFEAVYSIRGYFYSQEEIRDMLDAVKAHEHSDSDREQNSAG